MLYIQLFSFRPTKQTLTCIVSFILLLFGRSRIIVGHHRITDELFPAAAIFCSPCVIYPHNVYSTYTIYMCKAYQDTSSSWFNNVSGSFTSGWILTVVSSRQNRIPTKAGFSVVAGRLKNTQHMHIRSFRHESLFTFIYLFICLLNIFIQGRTYRKKSLFYNVALHSKK